MRLTSYRGTTNMPDTDEARAVVDWVIDLTGRAPRYWDPVYAMLKAQDPATPNASPEQGDDDE